MSQRETTTTEISNTVLEKARVALARYIALEPSPAIPSAWREAAEQALDGITHITPTQRRDAILSRLEDGILPTPEQVEILRSTPTQYDDAMAGVDAA